MKNNQPYDTIKDTRSRLVIAFILVFIIAFSNLGSFSILTEIELDKIEKLAEGETDIDFEEKEKNFEGEDAPYTYSNLDRFNVNLDKLHNDQYVMQLSAYHLKIPTPPPDFI